MSVTLTPEDLQQIEAHGLTREQVEAQIARFRSGFPRTQLADAATVENGGIVRLGDDEIGHYIDLYQRRSKRLKTIKFVPA